MPALVSFRGAPSSPYLDACFGKQGDGLGYTVLQPVLYRCGPQQHKVALNLLCHFGNLLVPALQTDTRLMKALVPLLQSRKVIWKYWRLDGLVFGGSGWQGEVLIRLTLAPLPMKVVTLQRCCLAADVPTCMHRSTGECPS